MSNTPKKLDTSFLNHFADHLRSQKASLDQSLYLRLYRANSWFKAAERYQDDPDMVFINLWIALKALVQDVDQQCHFADFCQFIDALDDKQALYSVCWHEYNDIFRELVKN